MLEYVKTSMLEIYTLYVFFLLQFDCRKNLTNKNTKRSTKVSRLLN